MMTQVDYLAISLLDNFQCELEEITLSPNLSIVRLDRLSNSKARHVFGEEAINLSKALVSEPSSPNTARLITYEIGLGNVIHRRAESSNHTLHWHFAGEVAEPAYQNFNRNEAADWFRHTLTALRLLKPEFVGRYPTCTIGDPSVTTGYDGYVLARAIEDAEYLTLFIGSPVYILELSEIDKLKLILKTVHNISNMSLRVAISRLNSQYTRQREEDRLIDAVVAFESIYLSGVNDELKFRLAVRAAAHLGSDDKGERTRIYELISRAYDLRSSIVHGSLDGIAQSKILKRNLRKRPEELLGDLTSLLRSSLRSILLDIGEGRFGSQQFHRDLDNSVVQGDVFK